MEALARRMLQATFLPPWAGTFIESHRAADHWRVRSYFPSFWGAFIER